jgi:hypothetical protein
LVVAELGLADVWTCDTGTMPEETNLVISAQQQPAAVHLSGLSKPQQKAMSLMTKLA